VAHEVDEEVEDLGLDVDRFARAAQLLAGEIQLMLREDDPHARPLSPGRRRPARPRPDFTIVLGPVQGRRHQQRPGPVQRSDLPRGGHR